MFFSKGIDFTLQKIMKEVGRKRKHAVKFKFGGNRLKSTTNSSKRSAIHYAMSGPGGRREVMRDANASSKMNLKKKRKYQMDRFRHLKFSPLKHMRGKWQCDKRCYFSGTKEDKPLNMPANSTGYSVFKFFQGNIVENSGEDPRAVLVRDEKDNVLAILAKRENDRCIFNKKRTKVFDELLEAGNLGNISAKNARSSTKLVAQTDGPGKYICLGPKCWRNRKGTFDLSNNLSVNQRTEIFNILKAGEDMVRRYVPPHVWKSHQEALVKLSVPMFSLHESQEQTTTIFPSLGMGKNVYLPSHVDNDCFLSVVSVCASLKDGKYDPMKILAYFCFPEAGFAVALRHGDTLVFDPRATHCISSKAIDDDVYSLSMYCKRALVGGNDNSRPLDAEEMKAYDLFSPWL